MNNKQQITNFTPSDDALIRVEQPVTRISIKTVATMLHTSQEKVMRRADELGVSLVLSDDYDGAVDRRPLRCSDGLVDPRTERLQAGARRPEVNTFRLVSSLQVFVITTMQMAWCRSSWSRSGSAGKLINLDWSS